MQEWWVSLNKNGGSTWSGIYNSVYFFFELKIHCPRRQTKLVPIINGWEMVTG